MFRDKIKQRVFQRKWQAEQRRKRKLKVIVLLGGKCNRCSYAGHPAAFQLDHILPLLRPSRTVRSAGSTTWDAVARGQIILDEVQLLCANCHAIKTFEEDRKKFKCWKGETV
jgi:5-methylcytosine-specific restriction endonuclease McrA